MFGIGEGELAIILLFAFLVFGPDKLPGIGRTVGRALRQFRNAQEGFTKVVQTEIVDPATEAMSDAPKKPNRKRAAESDDDADAAGEGATPRKAETFAERKKRLAEEKAAREAEEAAKADAAPQPEGDAADSDSDADAPEPSSAADEPGEAEKAEAPAQPAPEPSAKPSTADDLYAMRPKARPAKDAADAEESDAKTGEEGGTEQA